MERVIFKKPYGYFQKEYQSEVSKRFSGITGKISEFKKKIFPYIYLIGTYKFKEANAKRRMQTEIAIVGKIFIRIARALSSDICQATTSESFKTVLWCFA